MAFDPASSILFVLVRPQHPANVGAVARAMKNMGLRRLALVDPPAFDPERARWMAPGCQDVLAQMRIVPDLDQALEGVHQAIATTARHRKDRLEIHEPAPLAQAVAQAPEGQVTAILFGPEDHGLTREEVQACSALLRIPTPEHASLNLGQAALLVAQALFEEARRTGATATGRTVGGLQARATRDLDRKRATARATVTELEPAIEGLLDVLDRVGHLRQTPREKVALTARGALQRAGLSRKELKALRGMVTRIQRALER